MINRTGSETGRITRRAFREFDVWTERFSGMVQERARALAATAGTHVITSETLVEAVRLTCGELAAELSAAQGGCNSNGEETETAA